MIKKIFVSLLLLTSSAFGFDLKTKPIEVIIPFPPGGGVELTYRHFEKYASAQGINLVPIYKPGAEGLIAMRELNTGPKDGSRISFTTVAVYDNATQKDTSINVSIVSGIKVPLTGIFVSSKSSIKNADQFFSEMRTNEKLNIASGAPGQTVGWHQLFQLTQSPVRQLVTYKGAQPVITDVMGGHVDVGMVPLIATEQHIKNGKLRLLAHGGSRKHSEFPESTPIGARFPSWQPLDAFIVAVPGNDKTVVNIWRNVIKSYLADPSVRADFEKEYTEPMTIGEEQVLTFIKRLRAVEAAIPK